MIKEIKDIPKNSFDITYKFIFPDQKEKIFFMQLDSNTLELVNHEDQQSYPEWTQLNFCQCQHCSLKGSEHTHCPVATRIHEVVSFSQDCLSFHEVDVVVTTQERTYSQKVTLQKGVSSLVGIYMATSGCPVLAKLKHMVRFHLPFASPLESLNRILSLYLLSQYFRYRKGLVPDWGLEHLKDIYENIRILNKCMRERLTSVGQGDAHVNAIVCLDIFAMATTDFLDGESLNRLEPLFEAYFE